MTHYYDYYNHKFNSSDTPNPFKAPPEKYEPSKVGTLTYTNDNVPEFWRDNPCYCKAKEFAFRCGMLCKRLAEKRDFVVLSNYTSQLSKCSSSVLANLSEGIACHISHKERVFRYSICLREADESISWILLLNDLGEISNEEKDALLSLVNEIIQILNKSIGTIKKKHKI